MSGGPEFLGPFTNNSLTPGQALRLLESQVLICKMGVKAAYRWGSAEIKDGTDREKSTGGQWAFLGGDPAWRSQMPSGVGHLCLLS